MAPKHVALRQKLGQVAKAAGKRWSKQPSQSITCTYLGQRHGSDENPEYRANPSDWVSVGGERRSKTVLTFAHRLCEGMSPETIEIGCLHALAPGLGPPKTALSVSLRNQLEEIAMAAGKKCSHEQGQSVSCTYLGQRHGSDGNPEYHANPSE